MSDLPPKKKPPSAVIADQPTVISGVRQGQPSADDLLTRVADWSGDSGKSVDESRVTKAMTGVVKSSNDQTHATELHVVAAPKHETSAGTHQHQIWGDFEIGTLLGRGGMGAVYRGRQISLDRPVAIKVLPANLSENPSFRQRFQLEAKAVAQISSPHVVGVYYAGVHEGHHYFAMEYVEGQDLSVKVRDGFEPTHREALELVAQAARGLEVAGELGIVHRDIKPANMMVTKKGLVKLMDFGLVRVARAEDTGLTMAGTIMGTVSYFSPEQGRGERCDCRTDIYALGVVFYELLTRRLPFTGDDATSVIYQHIHQAPTPPKEIDPSIPESYQAVVLKCIQKDPDHRYQTASDLLKDLDALANGLDPITTLHDLKALRAGGTLVKKHAFGAENNGRRWLWAAALAVVVGAGIGSYVFLQLPPTSAIEPVKLPNQPTPVAVTPANATSGTAVSEARQRLTAGDFPGARLLIANGLQATPQDAAWRNVNRELDEALGTAELQHAKEALQVNDLTTAATSLATATRLLPADERVKALQAQLNSRSDTKKQHSRLITEAEALLSEGNPAHAEELLAPIASADPSDEVAATLLRRARKQNEELTARRTAMQERLAQGEDALARKEIDAALLHFTAAQQFDAKNARAAAGLEQVTKTKGVLSGLREQFEKAIEERNLIGAETSLKAMRQIAPGSPTLVLAENEFTNSKLVEETQAKSASEKEALVVAQAVSLEKLFDDPTQPVPLLEKSLKSFLERNGVNRPEKSAFEVKLEDRRSRAAAASRLAELDAALVKPDVKIISTLVSDSTFAKSLNELASEPGLVFVSSLNSFTRTGDSATANVSVRHALATYPERTLKFIYSLTRTQGGWLISGATLQP